MQSRIVFNMVNQTSICTDWENIPKDKMEEKLEEVKYIAYYLLRIEGKKTMINMTLVTDIFVEERDTIA